MPTLRDGSQCYPEVNSGGDRPCGRAACFQSRGPLHVDALQPQTYAWPHPVPGEMLCTRGLHLSAGSCPNEAWISFKRFPSLGRMQNIRPLPVRPRNITPCFSVVCRRRLPGSAHGPPGGLLRPPAQLLPDPRQLRPEGRCGVPVLRAAPDVLAKAHSPHQPPMALFGV